MKLKPKTRLIILYSVIIILCLFATVGTTCSLVKDIKNQEISDLKNEYEHEISDLNDDISEWRESVHNLFGKLHKYMIIGTWSRSSNRTNYIGYHNSRFLYMGE